MSNSSVRRKRQFDAEHRRIDPQPVMNGTPENTDSTPAMRPMNKPKPESPSDETGSRGAPARRRQAMP
jgi:hypothetical protein